MKTFHLTVSFKRFTKADKKGGIGYGYIIEKSETRHIIRINTDHGLIDAVGSLFHELGHWVVWVLLKGNMIVSKDLEHKWCDRLDRAARGAFKKMGDGK